MNYNEYVKHLEDNKLIESVESVQCIVNAIRVNDNIKRIRSISEAELASYGSYDLDPRELLKQLENDKEQYIKLAVKNCYPVDWAIQMFGTSYKFQVKELYANLKPDVAAIGINDLKQQGGIQ